jgi:hypothetical protein
MRPMIAVLCAALAGCGGMARERIVTVPVDRIVQRACPDTRPPADEFPDTSEKLSAIPPDDYEQLFKVAKAGRDLRDARLRIDDLQIKACAQ